MVTICTTHTKKLWSPSLFCTVAVGYRRFGVDMLSRNVGSQLPTYALQHQTSNTPRRESEIWHESFTAVIRWYVLVLELHCVYCQLGTEFIYLIYVNFLLHMAVPWFRRSVAGLSARRTGFYPRSVHARSVVDTVTLGRVPLGVFLQQYHFTTRLLHTHLNLHVVLLLL